MPGDVSVSHVGVALQQWSSLQAAWQPFGFFSAKLDPAQLNYSTFDRELFAIFASIRHFKHVLEGRSFEVWTDHKPLIFAILK